MRFAIQKCLVVTLCMITTAQPAFSLPFAPLSLAKALTVLPVKGLRRCGETIRHPIRTTKSVSKQTFDKFCAMGEWADRTGATKGVNFFGGLISAGANCATAAGVFTRGR